MRNRVAPAIVISAAALLVAALGLATTGAASPVAAVPRASVGTLQLKHNAVTAAKIAPGAVRTGHLANGAVTGAKVKTGTLGPEHFRNLPQGPRGPQGERGPAGERGPKGDIGPSDAFVTRGSVFNLTATSMTVATLTLPAGKYVIYTHVALTNPSTTQPVAVGCGVSAGGSLGETVTLDPRGGAHLAHHTLIYWEDMATGGVVTMSCAVNTALIGYPGTAATATFPTIAAIKVGALTVT
jgi:hypothetical protein